MKTQHLVAIAFIAAQAFAVESSVREAACRIPVINEVDVVVAGGSSGAAAAALAAAKAGAKVAIVVPRPYLGEDMAGTLRLWLEEGETPDTELAKKIFAPVLQKVHGAPFTYKANRSSVPPHKDTFPPSLLNDGQWEDAAHHSVQYDDNVAIDIDLGKVVTIRRVDAVVFTGRDYAVERMVVEASADGKAWRPCGKASVENNMLRVPLDGEARYLRCLFEKTAKAKRMLIGEIIVDAADGTPKAVLGRFAYPLHVKRVLDQALVEAGVEVWYSCYATDLITDADGKPAGLVMDDRAGRQAILAKVVVDATPNARLAQQGGAALSEFRAGPQTVIWTVIATNGPGATVRKLPVGFVGVLPGVKKNTPVDANACAWFEYSLKLELPDASWAARARIEQAARDKTYNGSQLYSPEVPFSIFPQNVVNGVPRLLVLAEQPRPLATMREGAKLGASAAEQAKQAKLNGDLRVAVTAPKSEARGKIMEPLAPLRPPEHSRNISQPERDLTVLGEYDVVVVGGGTAGAPAGIGAVRRGAKTLVIEYAGALGGVGTLGGIAGYYCGNRVGFTTTVPENPVEVRMEWYRKELRKAGADIWFGCSGVGAVCDGNRIKGVVVVTPYGRGVVLAPTVIDATGNADIAIAAGAKYVFVEDDYALQNSHVPVRTPGRSYVNGDIPGTDDVDPMHVREVMRAKWNKFTSGFDLGTVMASRERRRIVGDFTLDWLDSMNRRTFLDTVTLASSDYDSHGYQIHPYFTLTMPERRTKFWANIPYRSILPQGLDGVLVVGLAMSAHRDVMPITRMQPDLHNLGYAAGVAAAMAVKANVSLRAIDLKALQKHLVETGNLQPSVLTDTDSYPIPAKRIQAAVSKVVKEYEDAEVLMAASDVSLPLLRTAYEKAGGTDKSIYAHVLAAMGDNTGVPTLVEALRADKIPIARFSKGNGGRNGVIRALGLTRDKRALPVLLELAKSKEVQGEFQLRRSLALTLGRIGDPAASPALVSLLGDTDGRTPTIADLMTACALYRCGDANGKAARWLQNCVQQSDGTMSRLAQQTLAEKK